VHPQRSVITRALGTDPDVDVDAFSIDSQAGDIFLLCSDGLSSMIDARAIEEIIVQHRNDLAAVTKALIQAANRGGGEDNITAVLFELAEDDLEAAADAASEPDEPTREHAGEPSSAALDEEDTLHPEDGIAPPPSAVDTMVVPAAEIQAALAEHAEPEAARAGLGRRLLALVVIAALVAVIVALVWWGLAR